MIFDSHINNELTWLKDQITHVAFYTEYTPFSTTDTITSKHEIGRIAVTPTLSNKEIKFSYTLGLSDCVCPTTSISSVTSDTVFIVSNASNFTVGDRIEIDTTGTGSYQDCKILAKSTNTLTIDRSLSLATGRAVRMKISQKAIVLNGTSTSNSGEWYQAQEYIKYKSNTMTLPTDNIIIKLS